VKAVFGAGAHKKKPTPITTGASIMHETVSPPQVTLPTNQKGMFCESILILHFPRLNHPLVYAFRSLTTTFGEEDTRIKREEAHTHRLHQ